MRAKWPETKQRLKNAVAEIRSDEHLLYSYSYSTSLGYARTVTIRANGETRVKESTLEAGTEKISDDRTLQNT